MSYRDLYTYCHGLQRRPSRWEIIDKVVQLTGRPGRPGIMVVGYDPNILLGTIQWLVPDGHPMAQRCNGEPLITVARGIGRPWTRLVVVKEVMHYFDDPLSHVGNAAQFEGLINEFSNEQPKDSEAMVSESIAYWRALALFCPEVKRQEYARMRAAGTIDDAQIARDLVLPEDQVPLLFAPHFPTTVAQLLRC